MNDYSWAFKLYDTAKSKYYVKELANGTVEVHEYKEDQEPLMGVYQHSSMNGLMRFLGYCTYTRIEHE